MAGSRERLETETRGACAPPRDTPPSTMRHVCIAKEIIHGMCGRSGHFFYSTSHSPNAFVHPSDYFLHLPLPSLLLFSLCFSPFRFSSFLLFSFLFSIDPQRSSLFIAFVVGESKAYIYSVIKRASSVSGYEKKEKKSGIKYFALRRA